MNYIYNTESILGAFLVKKCFKMLKLAELKFRAYAFLNCKTSLNKSQNKTPK